MASFAVRLAYYYSELDALHPFREGKSRTLRPFMTDLAAQAGYDLDWSRIAQEKESQDRLYTARDLAVMTAETAPLTALLRQAILPVQQVKRGETLTPRSRVLVRNGQRLLQEEYLPRHWQTVSTETANTLKPGVYNLYNARPASGGQITQGMIVHIDSQTVFPQVGRSLIAYDRPAFRVVPCVGRHLQIQTDPLTGRAQVCNPSFHKTGPRSRSLR